jgi:hypothetical protein
MELAIKQNFNACYCLGESCVMVLVLSSLTREHASSNILV